METGECHRSGNFFFESLLLKFYQPLPPQYLSFMLPFITFVRVDTKNHQIIPDIMHSTKNLLKAHLQLGTFKRHPLTLRKEGNRCLPSSS